MSPVRTEGQYCQHTSELVFCNKTPQNVVAGSNSRFYFSGVGGWALQVCRKLTRPSLVSCRSAVQLFSSALGFLKCPRPPLGQRGTLDPVQMLHPSAGHPFRVCSCCEGRGGAESPGAKCYQSSGRNSETTVVFVGVCLQEEGPGMCFLVFSFPTNCDTQVGVKAAP